jgi:hypothetical protein
MKGKMNRYKTRDRKAGRCGERDREREAMQVPIGRKIGDTRRGRGFRCKGKTKKEKVDIVS